MFDDRVEHAVVAGAEEAEVPVGYFGTGDVFRWAGHAEELVLHGGELAVLQERSVGGAGGAEEVELAEAVETGAAAVHGGSFVEERGVEGAAVVGDEDGVVLEAAVGDEGIEEGGFLGWGFGEVLGEDEFEGSAVGIDLETGGGDEEGDGACAAETGGFDVEEVKVADRGCVETFVGGEEFEGCCREGPDVGERLVAGFVGERVADLSVGAEAGVCFSAGGGGEEVSEVFRGFGVLLVR